MGKCADSHDNLVFNRPQAGLMMSPGDADSALLRDFFDDPRPLRHRDVDTSVFSGMAPEILFNRIALNLFDIVIHEFSVM